MLDSLRPAGNGDLEFLVHLEEACMRGYVAGLGRPWTGSFEDGASLEGHRIMVEDGEDVGLVATVPHPDHLWLDKLYVSPKKQSCGIGSAALRRVRDEALGSGLPLRLCVLINNPAFAFYRRNGSTEFGRTTQRIFLEYTD